MISMAEYDFSTLEKTIKTFDLVSVDDETRETTKKMINKLQTEVKAAQTKSLSQDTVNAYVEWIEGKCDTILREALSSLERMEEIFAEIENPGISTKDPFTLLEEMKKIHPKLYGNLLIPLSMRATAMKRINEFIDDVKFDRGDLEDKIADALEKIDHMKVDLKEFESLKKKYEELVAEKMNLDFEVKLLQRVGNNGFKKNEYDGLDDVEVMRRIMKKNNITLDRIRRTVPSRLYSNHHEMFGEIEKIIDKDEKYVKHLISRFKMGKEKPGGIEF